MIALILLPEATNGSFGGFAATASGAENSGVEFIDENGGRPGLRLRKAHQQGMCK